MPARLAMSCDIRYHQTPPMMSSDVILDTVPCLPSLHHLVPVPSSSRIGYRMIPQCNPSHAIPDTTTSASATPYLIAPTASRPASRLTVSPGGSARSTTPSYTLYASPRLLTRLVHLIGSSIKPIACSRSDPCGGSSSHPSHRLIDHAPSDETSDEQGGTAHGTGNRQQESGTPRHPIPAGQRKCPSPPAV